MKSSDLPGSLNLPFVEDLHARYLEDPASVSPAWREYFERLLGGNGGDNGSYTFPREHAAPDDLAAFQDCVEQLTRAYRVRGHLISTVDPLGRPRSPQPELDPEYHGLTSSDLDREVSCRSVAGISERATLRQLLDHLRATYCRSIGVQFMHIDDLHMKQRLQVRMERSQNRIQLQRDEQVRILTRLTDATIFEEFIQKKYIGAKRFSLEGAESLIPLIDLAIEAAGADGVDEIVMGMAHRGRLNVLANIIGKSPREIFREFDDADPERFIGRGDVKYHLGHSGDRITAAGRKVHLSLCFNPSHLEFVNPVAVGRLRAKQDMVGDTARTRGMAILIHGDASFIAQGVVQETLNLSELPGYGTGGTLHVVVNNQIGFTTAPSEARSSLYATDVARMLQVPVFHVNGEDPEAVAQVVRLAMEFRRDFQRDVVIDMYGYRRHGHNEADEPAFTHPVMYAAIRQRPSVRESYLERLLALGEITREEANGIAAERRAALEAELSAARDPRYTRTEDAPGGIWTGFTGGREPRDAEAQTGLPRKVLSDLLLRLVQVPDDFSPHPRLERWFQGRRDMAEGKRLLDWSAAEALAMASLAAEGTRIRLSGQDSARGTFSQRHAVLHDVRTGEPYLPLQHLGPGQGAVEMLNSPLSEVGVMGFEYGYTLDDPRSLVMWEAQFGDFCNAAQVIIDQFIVSAEEKWRRLSGLVLLLPHGFEGQGPEHSSARLERFLGLCADDNIQVVNPTTPAQYFHLLRRQMLRPWRKPLVVMTPKSLLRHPGAVSALEELASGPFRAILPDEGVKKPAAILLCSGKVYYDLLKARGERKRDDVPILRLEQLYPLRRDELEKALSKYPPSTPARWVQEEPENMGAWPALRLWLGERLPGDLPFSVVARRAAASPATGSAASHELEQVDLIDRAFASESPAS